MVAALCIMGIFIYFFFWSRKVRKQQLDEWKEYGRVEETDVLQGIVTKSFQQKKRLFHHYWIMEIEAFVYNDQLSDQIKVIWRKPLTDHLQIPQCDKQRMIKVLGQKRDGIFYANRILTD